MPQTDWDNYGSRNLSRNRFLLSHHVELVEDFLRVMQNVPVNKKVLDIGPGNGFFLMVLRELGFLGLDAIEVSRKFVEDVRSKKVSVVLGNIATGDGLHELCPPYDVVLMMDVLEHVWSPSEALSNARQLLGTDGFLYLTVPICDCIFDRLRRTRYGISRRHQVRSIDETHIHAFSPHSLTGLLARSGFAVEELRRVSFRPPGRLRYFPGRRLFLLLRALLPNGLKGYSLSVVARPLKEEGS